MTGRVGDRTNAELWLRCPYCGDSQSDPEKAHFSINLQKFVFHCFRCQESGRLSVKQVFGLLSQLSGDMDFQSLTDSQADPDDDELPDIIPGAGSSRFSALDRYHFVDRKGVKWDAFDMRHPKDNLTSGIHLRSGKHKLSVGDKTAAWVGSGPLLSAPDRPLCLVEGPYDVIRPQDVCVFGLITRRSIEQFAGHHVVLCPDGDVWTNRDLFTTTVKTIRFMLNSRTVYIVGLERLPDNTDPDENPKRKFIPRDEIWEMLYAEYQSHFGG